MTTSKKDPVCGMSVMPERGIVSSYEGKAVYFCSLYCKNKFDDHPERYGAALDIPSYDAAAESRRVAYFSMEVALGQEMPTYSGGLGVLAGDTLKACADLRVPMVGVSLLYRRGYFDQVLDEFGGQEEKPVHWLPEHFLQLLPQIVEAEIEGRKVRLRAWRHDTVGISGYVVPVIFLDAEVEGNSDYDRTLTHFLYGGDERYRLAQEVILGIGGVRMLRALGHNRIEKFHMNEGHASLLVLELLRNQHDKTPPDWDFGDVRRRSVFTTHTPVPAGHDVFQYDLVSRVLGELVPMKILQMLGGEERLNMTLLALNLSQYVNGVAKRHEEISRQMFPGQPIHHITNGVHSWTWTSDSFKSLYDRYLPGWSSDPSMLRHAIKLPADRIWNAHTAAKSALLALIKTRTHVSLPTEALTIGFARRATAYKRPDLIFSDVSRLLEISSPATPIQLVFAGKAHPKDYAGKDLIRRIVAFSRELQDHLRIIYLENYDIDLAKALVAGVDLWLNTPERPLEASGTSGMKAAHNGVPSLSILDGWWIEGCVEGRTGWCIGAQESEDASDAAGRQDAEDLYSKLSGTVIPLFYRSHERWVDVMRHSIALNASYFNTHRMVQQYVTNAYMD